MLSGAPQTLCRGDRGLLVVLSAPSGAGKDTLIAHLLQEEQRLVRCVTATTRQPRDGELDGRDYHFVSEEQFGRLKERGELLEWAQVFGHLYGTPRGWVEEQLGQGISVILKIDVQGGAAVKSQFPDAVLIFVAPPSRPELERRLRGRKTDQEGDVEKRLAAADWEMSQSRFYDYLVVNDELGRAVETVRCILTAERCRLWPPGRPSC